MKTNCLDLNPRIAKAQAQADKARSRCEEVAAQVQASCAHDAVWTTEFTSGRSYRMCMRCRLEEKGSGVWDADYNFTRLKRPRIRIPLTSWEFCRQRV